MSGGRQHHDRYGWRNSKPRLPGRTRLLLLMRPLAPLNAHRAPPCCCCCTLLRLCHCCTAAGFYLLYHLRTLVGVEAFNAFFWDYIQTFKYKSITSEDFKNYFTGYFAEGRHTLPRVSTVGVPPVHNGNTAAVADPADIPALAAAVSYTVLEGMPPTGIVDEAVLAAAKAVRACPHVFVLSSQSSHAASPALRLTTTTTTALPSPSSAVCHRRVVCRLGRLVLRRRHAPPQERLRRLGARGRGRTRGPVD